jgi:hypothetical protein
MSVLSALLAAFVVHMAPAAYAVPDIEAIYSDQVRFDLDYPDGRHAQFTTAQQRAPDIILPTGAIVASDAIVLRSEPFERTVEPGRYQVILTLTRDATADKRVAFARIELRAGTPVRWEIATRAGEDPDALGPDGIFGYPVDSGTGMFADADTVALAKQNFDRYGDTLLQRLTDVFNRDDYWTNVVLDPGSGADVVAFTSGFGDGGYASYWGFDADDELVCLVTDFDVLTGATRFRAPETPPAEEMPEPPGD